MRRSFIFDCKPEKFAVTELDEDKVELRLGVNMATKMSHEDWRKLCGLSYTIDFTMPMEPETNDLDIRTEHSVDKAGARAHTTSAAQQDWEDIKN